MITKYNLFLDDYRIPTDVTWAEVPSDQHYTVVRNYKEFVEIIELRGLPQFVCYDHDLADDHYHHSNAPHDINYNKYQEKTGYHCAKWLVEYCLEKKIKHPPYVVHSLNYVGKENIISLIESYNKSI